MTLKTYRGGVMVGQIHGIDLVDDAIEEVFWSAAKDPTLTRWELCMQHHMQIWERDPPDGKISEHDTRRRPKKRFPAPQRYPVTV